MPGDVTNYVATLKDGVIQGGDSISCFSGTIKFDGDQFVAELTTRKYAELDRYLPVFGPDPTNVTIRGRILGPDRAVGVATSPQAPKVVANIEFRYLAAWKERREPARSEISLPQDSHRAISAAGASNGSYLTVPESPSAGAP